MYAKNKWHQATSGATGSGLNTTRSRDGAVSVADTLQSTVALQRQLWSPVLRAKQLCTVDLTRANVFRRPCQQNSDCRGHDLHNPRKDCSIAYDSYRRSQVKKKHSAVFPVHRKKERWACGAPRPRPPAEACNGEGLPSPSREKKRLTSSSPFPLGIPLVGASCLQPRNIGEGKERASASRQARPCPKAEP